ncbi:MAG: hypothetical protein ACXV4A_05295 [Actinomycetes bacterium]
MTTEQTPSLVQQLVRDLRANMKIADGAMSKVREDVRSGSGSVLDEISTSLRQLRADIGHVLAELDATTTDQRSVYLTEARRRLEAGRGVLDEMWLRSSLGRKDLRDETEQLLKAAENAWLAARNRLGDVQQDVNRTATDVRSDLENSLRAFSAALSEARAAFTRETSG